MQSRAKSGSISVRSSGETTSRQQMKVGSCWVAGGAGQSWVEDEEEATGSAVAW